MNPNDALPTDADVQITDDTSLDDADLDRELADDVDATIERLGELISIDSERQMATPFGQMSEADLLGLIRPSLWLWVASKRETALAAVGLIHRATGDVIEKHSDKSAEELAAEALDGEK